MLCAVECDGNIIVMIVTR